MQYLGLGEQIRASENFVPKCTGRIAEFFQGKGSAISVTEDDRGAVLQMLQVPGIDRNALRIPQFLAQRLGFLGELDCPDFVAGTETGHAEHAVSSRKVTVDAAPA